MKEYTGSFAPQVEGLRGTSSQLAALAKRYRVAYSVTPSSDGQSFEVSHGTAVYVFDRSGDAKLLFSGVATPNASLAGMTDDLKKLLSGTGSIGWWRRIVGVLSESKGAPQ